MVRLTVVTWSTSLIHAITAGNFEKNHNLYLLLSSSIISYEFSNS